MPVAGWEQSLLRYHEEKAQRSHCTTGPTLSTGTGCAGAGGLCLPRASGCGCGCPCKSLGTFWRPCQGPGRAPGTVNAAAGPRIPRS